MRKQLETTKPAQRFRYEGGTDKKGNELRFRVWFEDFKDEDTGDVIRIKRRELCKFNGKKVRWYSESELRRMAPAQRKSISLSNYSK